MQALNALFLFVGCVMFDKVVLCKQGSSILSQVRSRTLSLESGTVKVLLLGGDKIASNWNDIEVASGEHGLSVSLKEKQIPSYVVSSFFSCLSELNVVARCKDTDTPSFTQCHGVLVAVNNQAIILAVSDENIVVSDKLFMTFDVEETNNVLTAKADFDGVITQGILEERLKKIGDDLKLGTASQKDYSDNVLEENGGGKLPTNDAIKTYVKDGALHIVKVLMVVTRRIQDLVRMLVFLLQIRKAIQHFILAWVPPLIKES